MAASLETILLQCIACISYPIQFLGEKIRALIDFDSKANSMIPTYASKLGFWVHPTDVGAQKIDGSILERFGIVLGNF